MPIRILTIAISAAFASVVACGVESDHEAGDSGTAPKSLLTGVVETQSVASDHTTISGEDETGTSSCARRPVPLSTGGSECAEFAINPDVCGTKQVGDKFGEAEVCGTKAFPTSIRWWYSPEKLEGLRQSKGEGVAALNGAVFVAWEVSDNTRFEFGAVVTKHDSTGALLWTRNFAELDVVGITSIQRLTSDSLLLTGSVTIDQGDGVLGFAMAVDQEGEVIWFTTAQREFPDQISDVVSAFVQGDQIVIGGSSLTPSLGTWVDIWTWGLGLDGEELWRHRFDRGVGDAEKHQDVAAWPDGTAIHLARVPYKTPDHNTWWDYAIWTMAPHEPCKLHVFDHTQRLSYESFNNDALAMHGGLLLLGGREGAPARRGWVGAFDQEMRLQWRLRGIGPSDTEFARVAHITSADNGDIVVASVTSGCESDRRHAGLAAWISRYSSTGEYLWGSYIDRAPGVEDPAHVTVHDLEAGSDDLVYISGVYRGPMNTGGGYVAALDSTGARLPP